MEGRVYWGVVPCRRGSLVLAGSIALVAARVAVTPARAEPGPPAPTASPGPRQHVVGIEHDPPGEAPVAGPRYAPVTIEFFCDPGDGNRSARMHQLLLELREQHPRRVRVVYRLVARRGPSNYLVEAAHEAFIQGRFHAFLASVLGPGRSPRREDLPQLASDAGLDPARLERALAEELHGARVLRDEAYRRRRRVGHAPALLINGLPVDRPVRLLSELEQLYDEAYFRARALLDDGVPIDRLYPRLLQLADQAQPRIPIGGGMIDGTDPPEDAAPRPVALPSGDRHVRGPVDAPVVLTLFCSLQSRNCAQLYRTIEDLLGAYPAEVRLSFRHLYDPADPEQPEAELAHRAILCADEQGGFWRFYHALYEQQRRHQMAPDYLAERAREVDLDLDAFGACLGSRRHERTLARALDAARRTHITHTPALVIGGQLFLGTRSFEELQSLIEEELRPGLLETLAGALP
jgi:protein-disulfide isomerase